MSTKRARSVVVSLSVSVALLATLALGSIVQAGTTRIVRDLNPGASGSSPYNITAYRGSAFFVAWTPAHGAELWRSNGTAAGTRLVRDINPGAASSNPALLTRVGKRLYFPATHLARGKGKCARLSRRLCRACQCASGFARGHVGSPLAVAGTGVGRSDAEVVLG